MPNSLLCRFCAQATLVVSLVIPGLLQAAPAINNVNLRGLQIGAATILIVGGKDLLPDPLLVATFPISVQSVHSSSAGNRVEIEVHVPPQVTPGIHQIRIANANGISNPITVALDSLPQLPMGEKVEALPVALHGRVSGTETRTTTFRGLKGQRVVADVESQRLGARLQPVVRIKDSRGRQIAWSPPRGHIAGDARCEVLLPEDGEFSVEIHDLLYRAPGAGFFRLKLGDLQYADLAFPMGVQAGTKAVLHYSAASPALSSGVEFDATALQLSGVYPLAAPAIAGYTGGQPPVFVTHHPEVGETPTGDSPRQELPSIPVAVTGKLANPQEEDQYLIPVNPGTQLRVSVFAQSLGSPLDGVLAVRDLDGKQLAGNDDRPGDPDPGVEVKVPDGAKQLVLAIRDLLGRGGSDFIYRLEVTDVAAASFSVTASAERLDVPSGATQTLKVDVNRSNYNGKIKLHFAGLPANTAIAGDEIAEGAAVGLVSLTAGENATPIAGLVRVTAAATQPDLSLPPRPVLAPESPEIKHVPWLRNDLALAITKPAPVRIAWTEPVEAPLLLGATLPLKVALARGAGVKGSVRLRLLTTQNMPKKKVKENNQEKEVDDLDRALRLDSDVVLAEDATQATANVLVPASLPMQDWGLAVAADLLAEDNKTVLSSTTTTVITKRPIVPFALELAAADAVEAKAGLGPTGKLTGKLRRLPGFNQPVTLVLDGLPKDYTSPKATVPPDREDFEFPVSFAYGAKPGELKDIRLVAEFRPNPEIADLFVRSGPASVGLIKVVPGEPPPSNATLTVFEDDEKFVSYLSKGGGQITLDTQEKHSGNAAVKVTPDQRYHETVPGLNVKIREKPESGEYRYLRFAWKKKGGASVCLQLNHDGAWGVGGSGKPGAKFRYHAGPGGECYGASLVVDEKLPEDFVVVTRDLFADFGEFTLTGLALSPVDGEYALFDQIVLAREASDLK